MVRLRFLPLLLLASPPSALLAGENLSVDPRAFAWYAHGAAEEGRIAAIENLRAWLRDTAGSDDRRVFLARHCTVDALVRLRASLPGEELGRLLRGDVRDAAAVLVVRHATLPAARSAFDAMDEDDFLYATGEWIAVGNRLAREDASAAVVRLLARFTTDLRIYLDDDPGPVSYRRPVGSVPGDRIFSLPEGFPPIPVYHVDTWRSGEAELLADGPRPAYVRRYVCRERFGAGGSFGEPHRDDVRLEWLAAALETEPGELALERFPCRSLGYPSESVLLRRIAKAREEVARAFGETADRCREAGLLTAAERRWLDPRIAITIIDRRARKDLPVPDPPEEWTPPPPPAIPDLPPDPPAERPDRPRTR